MTWKSFIKFVYIFGQNIPIHERLPKFNSRLCFKKYLTENPGKFSAILWMPFEPETHFVCRFEAYLRNEARSNDDVYPDFKVADFWDDHAAILIIIFMSIIIFHSFTYIIHIIS